jgi:hypothetical protein
LIAEGSKAKRSRQRTTKETTTALTAKLIQEMARALIRMNCLGG